MAGAADQGDRFGLFQHISLGSHIGSRNINGALDVANLKFSGGSYINQ
jgi:hypothetical protein